MDTNDRDKLLKTSMTIPNPGMAEMPSASFESERSAKLNLLSLLNEIMDTPYPAWDDPEFAKTMSWRLGVIDTIYYLLGITAQLRIK